MAAKTKIIGVRVSERENEMIEGIAAIQNMTPSAILRLCLNGLLNGDIKLEKGELKIPEPEEDTPFGEKLERQFEKLRERGYPEKYIVQMKDQILSGVSEQIDMLPKKYNPKRMRSDDWGC